MRVELHFQVLLEAGVLLEAIAVDDSFDVIYCWLCLAAKLGARELVVPVLVLDQGAVVLSEAFAAKGVLAFFEKLDAVLFQVVLAQAYSAGE